MPQHCVGSLVALPNRYAAPGDGSFTNGVEVAFAGSLKAFAKVSTNALSE